MKQFEVISAPVEVPTIYETNEDSDQDDDPYGSIENAYLQM
ncbi:hypothetical protein Gogos_018519, partial [Gossypium gossypioides]|nr:hypothetical protein [Gossypium gossypioides]